MKKEEYITLLNITTDYNLEYLKHLSLDQLEKLYIERVEDNSKDKRN